MKYSLNLDKDNYVLSIAHTMNDNVELNIEDYDLAYLNAYQFIDNQLVLDELKLKELKSKEEIAQKEQEISILKEELATYDYIGTKLAMGVATKEEYAEQIAYTETIREQIRQLETFRTESEQPKEV